MNTPKFHHSLSVFIIVTGFLAGCVSNDAEPLTEIRSTSPTPKIIQSAPITYVKFTKNKKEVSIQVETNTVQFASLVWQSLSSALAKNPDARKFRISWWLVLGGTTRNSIANYDRDKQTLEYRSDGGYSGGGVIKEQFKYSRVTDNKLHKAAKAFGQYDSAEIGFKLLKRYGCKQSKP